MRKIMKKIILCAVLSLSSAFALTIESNTRTFKISGDTESYTLMTKLCEKQTKKCSEKDYDLKTKIESIDEQMQAIIDEQEIPMTLEEAITLLNQSEVNIDEVSSMDKLIAIMTMAEKKEIEQALATLYIELFKDLVDNYFQNMLLGFNLMEDTVIKNNDTYLDAQIEAIDKISSELKIQ